MPTIASATTTVNTAGPKTVICNLLQMQDMRPAPHRSDSWKLSLHGYLSSGRRLDGGPGFSQKYMVDQLFWYNAWRNVSQSTADGVLGLLVHVLWVRCDFPQAVGQHPFHNQRLCTLEVLQGQGKVIGEKIALRKSLQWSHLRSKLLRCQQDLVAQWPVLCYVILLCQLCLCHAMLCYAFGCYDALLCYDMLCCHAMLCYSLQCFYAMPLLCSSAWHFKHSCQTIYSIELCCQNSRASNVN